MKNLIAKLSFTKITTQMAEKLMYPKYGNYKIQYCENEIVILVVRNYACSILIHIP